MPRDDRFDDMPDEAAERMRGRNQGQSQDQGQDHLDQADRRDMPAGGQHGDSELDDPRTGRSRVNDDPYRDQER